MVMHTQNVGLHWSLYPLLATIGLAEFFCGLGQVLFCLPFYPLLIPIISGVFALITAFHALFLHYPNRIDFALQCFSAVLSFILLTTSVAESFCGTQAYSETDDHDDVGQQKALSMFRGICYGVDYRSRQSRQSCYDLLATLHNALASKLGISLQMNSIRFSISFAITGLAIAHAITCVTLVFYNARENRVAIRSYHGQMVIGLLLFPIGLMHRFYCATYFYTWLPILVAIYAIFQSNVSWLCKYHGLVRAVNIIGSANAMALTAAASFGLFCASTRATSNRYAFQRHCEWPLEKYRYCYRVIDFRSPYDDWAPEFVFAETGAVQMLANTWCCLGALALFIFSLNSAFTHELQIITTI